MKKKLFFLLFFFVFFSCKKKEESCPEGLNNLSIIGHRGVTTWATENSLQAIRQALYLNLDAVEFDIQASKEGDLVLFHDIDLLERTGEKGKVVDYTVAELKQFRLINSLRSVTNQDIPTLREALEEIDGKIHCFIDLKVSSKQVEENLVSILKEYSFSNFTILSFDNNSLLRLHSLDNSLKLCLLLYDESFLSLSTKSDYSHLIAIGVDYRLSNGLALEDLKKETGVDYIYMYTVNSIKDITQNNFRWIDGIITDNPEDWMLFRTNCL